MTSTTGGLLGRFVRQNDSEAFAEIVRLYSGLVYGACIRVLGDEDRAADATQETFFKLMKNASGITTSLPGWLHRVATHQAIDRLQKDARRRQREADYAADSPRETEHWADVSPYVDEELDRLDEETRAVIIQHFLEGRSTREIGRELGISQATVSRRVAAGVECLRAQLRRRGLLVAAAALGGWLGQNAAQAAPAVVLQELGKMAIVGGTAAAAGGAGAAGGTAAASQAAAGGFLAGLGTKAAVTATVAVISVGSVVTYHHVHQDESPPPPVVREERVVEPTARQRPTGPEIRIVPAAPPVERVVVSAPEEPEPEAAAVMTDEDREFEEWLAEMEAFLNEPVETEATDAGGPAAAAGGDEEVMGGGMMGGYAEEGAGFGGGMMMGGMGGGMEIREGQALPPEAERLNGLEIFQP